MAESKQILGDPTRPTTLVSDPESIDNPILGFFLAYWRAKRGTASLPLHSDFRPQEVRGHLPWVVVADALPNFEDFRYRVVGSHVCRYFLGDGTGKTVRESLGIASKEIAEGTVQLYRQACKTRTSLRLTGPASRLDEIYFPDFDTAYFPYSLDGHTADRIVNVFTFNYQRFLETRSQRVLTGAI